MAHVIVIPTTNMPSLGGCAGFLEHANTRPPFPAASRNMPIVALDLASAGRSRKAATPDPAGKDEGGRVEQNLEIIIILL